MKNTKLSLNLAERPIRIDLDQYTANRAFDLFDLVAAIRIKNSPFTKYPKEEGETNDQWRERIGKEAEKDQVRRDGEDTEVYLKRIFDSKHEMYNLSYEILNAICIVFGVETVSEERFKSANWMSVKQFIYDILTLGDIPASDFYTENELVRK